MVDGVVNLWLMQAKFVSDLDSSDSMTPEKQPPPSRVVIIPVQSLHLWLTPLKIYNISGIPQ